MVGTDRQGYVPGELIGFSAEVTAKSRVWQHLEKKFIATNVIDFNTGG